MNLLQELFGIGGAQAADLPPSTFTPPVGEVPVPMARPANLGQVPELPTVPTVATDAPGAQPPQGNILARLRGAGGDSVAGKPGVFDGLGRSGTSNGVGRSKFGAFAAGVSTGMKDAEAAKSARAASERQSKLDNLAEIKTLFGMDQETAKLDETRRYHDILGENYKNTNDRLTAGGSSRGGGGGMTPASIELARSRAAKRLGLLEPLPQYATDAQKQEHAARRAEAQTRFDQWDSSQPWAGRGGAPAARNDGGTPAPAPASTSTPPAAAPAQAPAATPAASTWVKVRNRQTGEVHLYNPATKAMKPLEGE